MIKNKKAEYGPIAVVFMVMLFFVNWVIWIADWVSEVGQRAIVDNGLTGVEAWGYANLNLFIFIVLVLAIIGGTYFSQ